MASARRLSLGTPYRLSREEQELFLAEIDSNPDLAEKVAGMLGVDVKQWRKRPAQKRLQDLARYEQGAASRATLAKAMEAHRRFDEEAEIAISGVTSKDVVSALRDELQELKQVVQRMDREVTK